MGARMSEVETLLTKYHKEQQKAETYRIRFEAAKAKANQLLTDSDKIANAIELSKTMMDLDAQFYRLNLREKWIKVPLNGFYPTLKVKVYDFGRIGGGSRGPTGDADPEPTYWIENKQKVLIWVQEPTQELKQMLLNTMQLAGAAITEAEALWEQTRPFEGCSDDKLVNGILPCTLQIATDLGIDIDELKRII